MLTHLQQWGSGGLLAVRISPTRKLKVNRPETNPCGYSFFSGVHIKPVGNQYHKTSVRSHRWGGWLGLALQRPHPLHNGLHRVKMFTHVSEFLILKRLQLIQVVFNNTEVSMYNYMFLFFTSIYKYIYICLYRSHSIGKPPMVDRKNLAPLRVYDFSL